MVQTVMVTCGFMSTSVNPDTNVCDFELAAISAAKSVLVSQVNIQGSFYHLTQSTWRKLQELCLNNQFCDDENVKHFCVILDAFAFPPFSDIPQDMSCIQRNIPHGNDLVETTFDSMHITGSVRVIQQQANSHWIQPPCIRRVVALFPPALWNALDSTVTGTDRTNNLFESWNNDFAQLVGHSHSGLWALITSQQQDETMASNAIQQDSRGHLPVTCA